MHYYEVLGVDPGASADRIREAVAQKGRAIDRSATHDDAEKDRLRRFLRFVVEPVLTDEARRAQYDRSLAAPAPALAMVPAKRDRGGRKAPPHGAAGPPPVLPAFGSGLGGFGGFGGAPTTTTLAAHLGVDWSSGAPMGGFRAMQITTRTSAHGDRYVEGSLRQGDLAGRVVSEHHFQAATPADQGNGLGGFVDDPWAAR